MAQINNELLNASINASNKYGIPTSVILGFAGLETSYGTKGVGTPEKGNNIFGVTGKKYDTIEDSVEDFAKLVTGNKESAQSKKYGDATSGAISDREWVDAITQAGYNSEYAPGVYEDKVMSVINGGELSSYNGLESRDVMAGVKTGLDLKWWGDIVIVVFAILLLIGGVAFLGLAVTSNAPGSKLIKSIKKGVS